MAEEKPKVKSRFLTEVVARKRREVETGRRSVSEGELRARAAKRGPARPWAAALLGPGLGVVAELKRRSPSAGALAPELHPAERALLYAAHGAAAVSVLTDAAFDGRLDDLEAVAGAVDVPVLRKDFLVDPWQIWESRAAGADAVLLIVAALDDRELRALAETADEAGLGVLVEVHAAGEIHRAAAIEPAVVGVNARDLTSLEVDLDGMIRILGSLGDTFGEAVVRVAESGVSGPADARRMRAAGADAILVGEHLVRATDPADALSALIEAGAAA